MAKVLFPDIYIYAKPASDTALSTFAYRLKVYMPGLSVNSLPNADHVADLFLTDKVVPVSGSV